MKSEIRALPGIIRDKLLQKRKNLKYVERKAKMYHGFSMVLLSVMTAFSLTACGGSQAVSETGIFEPIEYGSTSPDDPDMVNHYPKGDTSRSSESFQEGDSSIRDFYLHESSPLLLNDAPFLEGRSSQKATDVMWWLKLFHMLFYS